MLTYELVQKKVTTIEMNQFFFIEYTNKFCNPCLLMFAFILSFLFFANYDFFNISLF